MNRKLSEVTRSGPFSGEATVIQRTALVTKIQIGANCSVSFGKSSTLKVRQFGCDGSVLVFGTIHTIVVDSTGLIDGTGTIYHSFSRTSDESKATITPTVKQVDIDKQDYDGVYDPAFDGMMQSIFGDYGTLAVIAMEIPFILVDPDIPK